MVVMPSVMGSSGVRGNDRAGQNRKCNENKQQIAELHVREPLIDPAAQSSGRSWNEYKLT